jgi:hypothetical protein
MGPLANPHENEEKYYKRRPCLGSCLIVLHEIRVCSDFSSVDGHTCHILRPLDVGVFHAFKHWHSEFFVDPTYSGCENINNTEFFMLSGQFAMKL